MESNWRFDVARAGLVGFGIKFYARLRDLPDYWMGKYNPDIYGTYPLFYWPDPEQLPLYVGSFAKEGSKFPYGVPVYTDRLE